MLPTGTLWNSDHELIGYKMPYIGGVKPLESDRVETLFEELEILKQDLDFEVNPK